MDKRHKFSLSTVDLAIILITVTLCCVGVFLMQQSFSEDDTVVDIEYTICMEGIAREVIEDSFIRHIAPQARVYSENGTAFLGTVVSVKQSEHYQTAVRDGIIETVAVEGLADGWITVSAKAALSEGNGLRVSDIRIAACGKGSFRVGGYYVPNARIVSVERK